MQLGDNLAESDLVQLDEELRDSMGEVSASHREVGQVVKLAEPLCGIEPTQSGGLHSFKGWSSTVELLATVSAERVEHEVAGAPDYRQSVDGCRARCLGSESASRLKRAVVSLPADEPSKRSGADITQVEGCHRQKSLGSPRCDDHDPRLKPRRRETLGCSDRD